MPKSDLQVIHNVRNTIWNKKLKRIAQDWSQFNMPESTVLDVFIKHEKHPGHHHIPSK
jgi:hypothetical protein